MDMGRIWKLLIMVCGVYLIYWAAQMKATYKIPEMLVGKGFPISRAKDPEGFMKATFPFTMGMGILFLVTGMMGVFDVLVSHPFIDNVITLSVLIVLILYGMFLLRAQKKYLIGLEDSNEKKDK